MKKLNKFWSIINPKPKTKEEHITKRYKNIGNCITLFILFLFLGSMFVKFYEFGSIIYEKHYEIEKLKHELQMFDKENSPIVWIYRCSEESYSYETRDCKEDMFFNITGVYCKTELGMKELCKNEYVIDKEMIS